MEQKQIRVLIQPEGNCYIAQCLEYDIAAQAPNIPKLITRFVRTLSGHVILAKQHGDQPFSKLSTPPSYFAEGK